MSQQVVVFLIPLTGLIFLRGGGGGGRRVPSSVQCGSLCIICI